MICNKDTAKKTAKQLLAVNAVKLQPENPFTWASGWKSPIYCDNRVTLSYPEVRDFLKIQFAEQIQKEHPDTQVIAGVATGAIAIGALVADYMGLPFVYVRPEAKSHGRKNQIEGYLEKGKKVLVIEDLISTGMSSMNAVNALRESGVEVLGMLAIFSYGFPKAVALFEREKVPFKTLSNYEVLLEEALQSGDIEEKYLTLLENWRKSPDTYQV